MSSRQFEDMQFAADWAQLVVDDVQIIVPAKNYDVSEDDRILIPIISHHKIGFVNHNATYVIKPRFDKYLGDAYLKDDLIKVANRFSYGLPGCKEGQIYTYDRDKWGVIDTGGNVIIDTEYKSIAISDNKRLFTLLDFSKGYCVQDRNGNVILPYGQFDYIDGFSNGFARVKVGHMTNGVINSENKWGIINEKGDIVLPMEYDNIWNFYQKERSTTKVIKNGVEKQFDFNRGGIVSEAHRCYNNNNDDDDDDDRTHYGEFAGSYAQDVMGYSDDDINDAFDGDPDAYWNID